jgi:uncharacterized protein YceH (UPF0502 family)
MYHFATLDDVARALDRLAERDLAVRQERRPGQKEERYAQLLGEDAAVSPSPRRSGSEPQSAPDEDRVAALEARIDRLEDEVEALRRSLDAR